MMRYSMRAGGATAVARDKGGELVSYIPKGGKEMLWTGDAAFWAGQAPLLFPIVGSAADDRLKIAGKEYTLGKHGFARNLTFACARRGEDFIELRAEATDATRQCYPFDFALSAVHQIGEDGFSTTFIVENRSGTDMPFCIGGHPGFLCPMREGERFEDYELRFAHIEDGENSLAPGGYIVTGKERLPELAGKNALPLRHTYFDEKDALILTNLKSRSVKLVHKESGKGIEFNFPKFDALGVWTMPGKEAPYICLEPWSGIPAMEGESGNMEDKPYVKTLRPGESYRTGYTVKVL